MQLIRLIVFVLSVIASMSNPATADLDREASVCGGEAFIAWVLRWMAGSPDILIPKNQQAKEIKLGDLEIKFEDSYIPLFEEIAEELRPSIKDQSFLLENEPFRASDDTELMGYKLRLTADNLRRSDIAVLFAHGNAMLADQTVRFMTSVASLGVDTFVYDYRGFGRSWGKTRLRAISIDFQEITSMLKSKYDVVIGYGASFGGVIFLHANTVAPNLDHIVLDGVPDKITSLDCPDEYNPIDSLPLDSANISLIYGGKDSVVTTSELPNLLNERAGRVMFDPELAHPFMDSQEKTVRRRWTLVAKEISKHFPDKE